MNKQANTPTKQRKQRQQRELADLLNWIGFPDGPPLTVTLKQLHAAAMESSRFDSARVWLCKIRSAPTMQPRMDRQGYNCRRGPGYGHTTYYSRRD